MPKSPTLHPIYALGAYDVESGELNAIIETPKGNRNKFKYDRERRLFKIDKILPAGTVFPFDFGFVPSTQGEDGDPLDVLVLMDEPAFTGCLVPARLVGVIEAEQMENGRSERNDRLICVASASQEHRDIKNLKELSPALLEEIEHFFESYHVVEGTPFQPIGRFGPNRAAKLVDAGVRAFRRAQPKSTGKNGKNGK